MSHPELLELFAARRVLERVASGEYTEDVFKWRHPARPLAHEPYCTRSEMVRYLDRRGRLVAIAHRYLRPNGTIGASGRPDPKAIYFPGEVVKAGS